MPCSLYKSNEGAANVSATGTNRCHRCTRILTGDLLLEFHHGFEPIFGSFIAAMLLRHYEFTKCRDILRCHLCGAFQLFDRFLGFKYFDETANLAFALAILSSL